MAEDYKLHWDFVLLFLFLFFFFIGTALTPVMLLIDSLILSDAEPTGRML